MVDRHVEFECGEIFLYGVHHAFEPRIDDAFQARGREHVALLVQQERVHEDGLGNLWRPFDERAKHLVLAAGAMQEKREDHQIEQAPFAPLRPRLVERLDRDERLRIGVLRVFLVRQPAHGD